MSEHTGWVWTKTAQEIRPDRKAGDMVPPGFMPKAYDGRYFPYQAWIKKGYVREIGASE